MVERTFFLDIPFRTTVPGATYNARLKRNTFTGSSLPEHLAPYHSPDFSLTRWHEDNYNRKYHPVQPVPYKFTPRGHQKDAAKAIALFRKRGAPGFFEGDSTGLGKTISTVLGIYGSMRVMNERKANILVICPKSVITHWSNTFKALGLTDTRKFRICVVNYEQSMKLLKPPGSAANAKRMSTKNRHTAAKGVPTVQWDYIIADESHKLKNSEVSQRSQAFERIAQYGAVAGISPFVIYVSATVGQTPLELQYLRPLLYWMTGEQMSMPWEKWLKKHKFSIDKSGRGGKMQWNPNDRDLNYLNKLLFGPKSPSIRRKPEDMQGWPVISRNTLGSDLAPTEWLEYQKEWLGFRGQYKLALRGKNPQSALVKQLRFRQKSSIIRAKSTAEHIQDFVENGYRVVVSIEFMESIDIIKAELDKKKISSLEYSGRNQSVREDERVKFQKGAADVMFITAKESVSVHAGETLPDGTKGDMKPRVTLCHDIRYSALDMLQIEGRAHRDGQLSNIYYLYANHTVEEKIATTMIKRMSAVSSIMDDERLVEELGQILVQKDDADA